MSCVEARAHQELASSAAPLCVELERADQPVGKKEQLPAPICYSLHLGLAGIGFSILVERLTQQIDAEQTRPFKYIESRGSDIRYYDVDSKALVRPTWGHKPFETSLAQVPRMFRPAEQFRETLASLTTFHALDVSPRAPVRQPQAMRPVTLLVRHVYDVARIAESTPVALHAAREIFPALVAKDRAEFERQNPEFDWNPILVLEETLVQARTRRELQARYEDIGNE